MAKKHKPKTKTSYAALKREVKRLKALCSAIELIQAECPFVFHWSLKEMMSSTGNAQIFSLTSKVVTLHTGEVLNTSRVEMTVDKFYLMIDPGHKGAILNDIGKAMGADMMKQLLESQR